MKTALTASLALTLAACGGPLFNAEVQEQKICLRFPSENVPAAPIAVGTQTVTTQSTFDIGSQIPGLDKDGTTGTLKITSLSMTGSGSALQDIQAAEVDVPDDTGALQPTFSFATTAPTAGAIDCSAGSSCTVSMKVARDADLLKVLVSGKGSLPYKLSMTGQPPTTPWTVAIDVCLSGDITVDLLKVLKN